MVSVRGARQIVVISTYCVVMSIRTRMAMFAREVAITARGSVSGKTEKEAELYYKYLFSFVLKLLKNFAIDFLFKDDVALIH